MKVLIVAVIAAIVIGIAAAAEQLGIGTQLKDRRGRFLTVLGVTPIAVVCGMVITYIYLAGPLWLLLVSSPLIVALGVAAAIFLVGRSLPDKISNREE
ncbi:MAG TPA: hypothetical protein VJX29_03140 [Candidatus Acidoferrales bacterium]|nr:hypothetical protein [Candidatus Acidoferrales bacterium]